MKFTIIMCESVLLETISNKIIKYQPLIDSIIQQGWKVEPFIVITTITRGTTHALSMKQLEIKFNLCETSIKHTFKTINTIAIHYDATSILLHKKQIENNQPIPTK